MVTPFVNDKNGDPVGVAGFDALDDTIAGPQTRRFTFRTPTGGYDFDAGETNTARLTQVTAKGEFDFGNDVTLIQSLRYRDSYQKRNSITPRSVYSYADMLGVLAGTYKSVLPAGSSIGLSYTDGAGPYSNAANGNGLVLVNLARSFTVPEKEMISDTRFQKSLNLLGHHDFAAGFYFAHVDEDYRATSASILTDVKGQAALLDAYIVNADGSRGAVQTENGVLSYGTEFGNSHGTSETIAFYGSNEWKITDRLRLDGGARWERISVSGLSEGQTTANLGQSPTFADNAVLVGNGAYTPFRASYDHAAWTAGLNYQFVPSFGVFGRYTSTYRLPGVSSFFRQPHPGAGDADDEIPGNRGQVRAADLRPVSHGLPHGVRKLSDQRLSPEQHRPVCAEHGVRRHQDRRRRGRGHVAAGEVVRRPRELYVPGCALQQLRLYQQHRLGDRLFG